MRMNKNIQSRWLTISVVIEKQQFFKMQRAIVNIVGSSKYLSQLLRRIVKSITAFMLKYPVWISSSRAIHQHGPFSTDGLVDYKLPSGLQSTKFDAIASFGL